MIFPHEEAFIVRLKKGDKKTVEQWYTLSKQPLLRFFQSQVRSIEDGDELLHDTLLSCLASLPLFRGKSGLYSWMVSVARHELADYWRKKYAKKLLQSVPLGDEILRTAERPSESSTNQVKEVCSRLPAVTAELLLLKYVDKRSVLEIAHMFGVEARAMQSRIHRAKLAFIAEYEKDL